MFDTVKICNIIHKLPNNHNLIVTTENIPVVYLLAGTLDTNTLKKILVGVVFQDEQMWLSRAAYLLPFFNGNFSLAVRADNIVQKIDITSQEMRNFLHTPFKDIRYVLQG